MVGSEPGLSPVSFCEYRQREKHPPKPCELVDLLFSLRLKACALCSISGSVCPIDAKLCRCDGSRPPAALLLTLARSSATIRPTVNCRSAVFRSGSNGVDGYFSGPPTAFIDLSSFLGGQRSKVKGPPPACLCL